jgi:hypothetical protein
MQKAAIQRAPKALSAPAGGATRSSETDAIRHGGWRARVKRLKTATVFRSPRTLTTARPSRCDDTPKKVKHQLLVSRWMGESAALRRAIGSQSSGARVERRQRRARRRHTSSEWLWITKMKLRMYVSSWRTCLRWLEALSLDRRQAPKWGRSLGHTYHSVYGIHSEKDPVQSNILTPRKMDARNGGTRQRLSRKGAGGQAVCLGGEDGSRSKGSAVIAEIRANAESIRLSQPKVGR